MVGYLVAAVLVALLVALVAAALTGRVKVRSCCAADPSKDLRMRAAFTDESGHSRSPGA
jgi:hypothetical protein